jgi:hypothetical protein
MSSWHGIMEVVRAPVSAGLLLVLLLTGCSSSHPAANSTPSTTKPVAIAEPAASIPTPNEEVSQCQIYGRRHQLQYLGIDGPRLAGGKANRVAAQLRANHLSAAPWDRVARDDLVYACVFVRPVTTETIECSDGSKVPNRTVLSLLIDGSGRSSEDPLDERRYC